MLKNFFTSLLFLALVGTTMAQTISVQGVLRDPRSRTVDNGFYEVKFSLYEQAANGTALWSETHPSVPTNNGLFAAKLGSYSPIDILPFDTTYYLGISVEGRAELTPRMELTISPYALGIYGQDNTFPSVGDVKIKTNLSISNGDITVTDGDMRFGNGNVTLDAGNFTITQGDIVINDAGAAIRFFDGTLLNTAFGGTAANLSNANSVIIAGDSDKDGAGGIEMQVGITNKITVANDGNVTVANDVTLDSGNLVVQRGNMDMTKGSISLDEGGIRLKQGMLALDNGNIAVPDGGNLSLGHVNYADSSFTQRMNIASNGNVTFSGKVQSSGTPTQANDLVNLTSLNAAISTYLSGSSAEAVYPSDPALGSSLEGGAVFLNEGNFTYIVNTDLTNTYRLIYGSNSTWSSSSAIGAGKSNTQAMFGVDNAQTHGSDFIEVRMIDYPTTNGYSDWWIPSSEELISAMSNAPNLFPYSNYWASDIGDCGLGQSNYVMDDPPNSYPKYCDNGTSARRVALVRRIPRAVTITGDDSSLVTVGFLLSKIGELEAKIDALAGEPIGSAYGGGIVWQVSGGFNYIAYSESGRHPGQNTYRNGYGDWYLASKSEIEEVLRSGTSLNISNQYDYWLSESCGSDGYKTYHPLTGQEICDDNSNVSLLIRREAISQ